MITLCSTDCTPICDSCKYYNFNGDDEGRYTGDGRCILHNNASEPYDACEDFYCFLIDKEKEGGK